jgi:hypothetical protein
MKGAPPGVLRIQLRKCLIGIGKMPTALRCDGYHGGSVRLHMRGMLALAICVAAPNRPDPNLSPVSQ